MIPERAAPTAVHVIRSIARREIGLALKRRLVRLLFLGSILPPLVLGIVLVVRIMAREATGMDLGWDPVLIVLSAQAFPVALVALGLGTPSVARDRSEDVLYLYAVRPVSPWTYTLGKMTAVIAPAALLLLGPAILVAVLRQGLMPEVVGTGDSLLLVLKAAVCSILLAVGYAGISVGPSAATRRARWALLIALAFYMIPDAIGGIVLGTEDYAFGPGKAAGNILGALFESGISWGAAVWNGLVLAAYGVAGAVVTSFRVRKEMIPVSAPNRTGSSIALESASVFYGEVVGLSHVTLDLGPGITGLVGPNGSGKTTLMRVLTGLVRPGEGTVRVLGGDPFASSAIRTRISFVPAGESFYESLTARRNLEVAFLARGDEPAEARRRAGEALEAVRLQEHADRRFGVLSRGMRQRLKIGLALIGNADLVLLDEPFLGVDPPNRYQLRQDILRLGASGRIVLVSSHVLHEVEDLTDRVGILAHGRLLGLGRIADLLRDLRDRHPHRVQLQTDDPRRLGSLLLEQPHVRELRVMREDGLEFVTDRPDEAYRELASLVVASGAPIRHLETIDDGLEAVFRHMTEAGTRRL